MKKPKRKFKKSADQERRAAAKRIVNELSPKEREAMARFAEQVKDFPFPKDAFQATRQKIAKLEERLAKEVAENGPNSERMRCLDALMAAGYTGLDNMSWDEIVALYRKVFRGRTKR